MAVDFFSGRVVRGMIQNLATAEELQFQFNPQQLNKALATEYIRQKVLGGTRDRLHYRGTGNLSFPLRLQFSLADYIDRHRGAGRGTLSEAALKQIVIDFEDQRNFFLSFLYPVGAANDPLRRSPPTALLLWPKNVAMEVVVLNYQDSDTLFNTEQQTRMFSINLNFEESRRWRMTSSMARRVGFKRHGIGGR